MERPDTAAEVLDVVAELLDAGDVAFTRLLQADPLVTDDGRVITAIEGDEVQTDVRMIATWLREHPEVDSQIMNVLSVFPAADTP